MKEYLRIKIRGSIYYLNDGQISIYRKSPEYCIIKQKSKEMRNYQIKLFTEIDEEGDVPLRLDKQGDNIRLYINKTRSFDIYCYTGSEKLDDGINILDIPEKKSYIVIGNEDQREYIYLESIKRKTDNINQNKYKNDLLEPYENKTIGNYLNKDINDLSNIVNILQKSESARYLGKGGSRIVFKIKDKSDFGFLKDYDGSIIKVARYNHNIHTNRRENQTWQGVKGTQIEKYFCPITNHGPEHKYIVMREAKCVRDRSEKYKKMADHISNNIKKSIKIPEEFEYDPNKYDLLESMIRYDYDVTADNIGEYKDRCVLVDYPFGALIKIEDN